MGGWVDEDRGGDGLNGWVGGTYLLMTALSSVSRNMRGLGLPSWGRGVTLPISTNPRPRPVGWVGGWVDEGVGQGGSGWVVAVGPRRRRRWVGGWMDEGERGGGWVGGRGRTEQAFHGLGVLIKAGRHANGVGKDHVAPELDPQGMGGHVLEGGGSGWGGWVERGRKVCARR